MNQKNTSTNWLTDPVKLQDSNIAIAAQNHQLQLTKPPGALGQLEDLAVQMAQLQGNAQNPRVDRIHISIFAGDHGIVDEGVSAFPQAVTVEMIKNFSNGGAAINVLANQLDAHLEVINTGTVTDTGKLPRVLNSSIGPGTNNFAKAPAMNAEQLAQALYIGREAIERAEGSDLFIGGEMGIGNTTSATALTAALLKTSANTMVGPGTGLDQQGVIQKGQVIQGALDLHQEVLTSPLETLRVLGGYEIAALCGAYIAAAQAGIPAVIDGFITSAAALCAVLINPSCRDWMIFSHTSAEPGHQKVLAEMKAKPLLNLGMRLGEGSGAATATSLLKSACLLHSEMATFATAGVSEKEK